MYYLTEAGVKFINELSDKDIEQERGEFERVAGGDKKKTEREMAAARKGRETTTKSLKGVENTDATDIKPGFSGLRKAVRILKKGGRDRARRRRVYNQVKSGTQDASIIRLSGKGKDKKRELVAGNTRAMMSRALGKPIKVHVYRAIRS